VVLMKDDTDKFMRQALKNWAVEQQPPTNGRARLLLVAASIQREQADDIPFNVDPKDFASNLQSPLDQAMRIYNLPWLDISNLALSPTRRVT
jgi:hypothetical protein